jgi:hypothetical protein
VQRFVQRFFWLLRWPRKKKPEAPKPNTAQTFRAPFRSVNEMILLDGPGE